MLSILRSIRLELDISFFVFLHTGCTHFNMRHPVVKWMEIGGYFDLTSMKLHEVQATIIWGSFWGGLCSTHIWFF